MRVVRNSGADQELDPELMARRNKLLGLWAAERMGMIGETAVDYALSLVAPEADKSCDDAALVKKVCEDMGARGYPIGEVDIIRQLEVCVNEALNDTSRAPER